MDRRLAAVRDFLDHAVACDRWPCDVCDHLAGRLDRPEPDEEE